MALPPRDDRFGPLIAASAIQGSGFVKLFGPQSADGDPLHVAGDPSPEIALTVTRGAKLTAPCDCSVSLVRDPKTGARYLALRLHATKTLAEVWRRGLLQEVPTFLLIAKESDVPLITFRGLDDGYLHAYVAALPKPADPVLPGELGLRVMAGETELFFRRGEELGSTAAGTLTIQVLTTFQVRPSVEPDPPPGEHGNVFWPEVERRNRMDPIAFWNALARAHEAGVSVFATEGEFGEVRQWFASHEKTPHRIVLEVRDEFNTPLSASDDVRSPWIEVRSTESIASPDGGKKTVRLSQAQGGFLVIPTAASEVALVSIRSNEGKVPPPVVSKVDEQFVFWIAAEPGRGAFIDQSGAFNLGTYAHVVIQAFRPADWFSPQSAVPSDELRTRDSDAARALSRYTVGNDVRLIVDGNAYFETLAKLIVGVDRNASEHFLHLAGWSLDVSFAGFPVGDRHERISLKDLLTDKLERVRALIWDNWLPGFDNLPALNFLNGFAFGDPSAIAPPISTECRAVYDNREVLSANHMKIATVCGERPPSMRAFCGGIDAWPDRVTDGHHRESNARAVTGLHDTMLEVNGQAAVELDRVLHKRWVDAVMNKVPARTPNKASFAYLPYTGNGDEGTVLTQVGLTIDSKAGYAFATNGDTTLLQTLQGAIANARQFIYIEDQYFRDPAIIAELDKALMRGVVVILLMPLIMWGVTVDNLASLGVYAPIAVEIMDPGPVPGTPQSQTAQLRASYPDSFAAFHAVVPPSEIYVHSKLWIVDDIFVSCGSANVDRKGMGSEPGAATSCECNLFNVDTIVTQQGTRAFARDARIRLWSEHLFDEPIPAGRSVETSLFFEQLVDPVQAFRKVWKAPIGNGRVRPLV